MRFIERIFAFCLIIGITGAIYALVISPFDLIFTIVMLSMMSAALIILIALFNEAYYEMIWKKRDRVTILHKKLGYYETLDFKKTGWL